MEFFTSLPEALEIELILRAIGFIFVFFGVGLLFSESLNGRFFEQTQPWKRKMIRLFSWVAYGLSLLNVIMAITWTALFFWG